MKELMKKAKEFEMPAVAITDHGNLHGAIEFYQEATKGGDQADHRLRGVHGAGRDERSAKQPARRGLSFHAAGEGRNRLPQPGEDDFHRAPRRISLQAADRQGAAGEAFGRVDRYERLSQGRDQHGDPVGQSLEGAARARPSSATFSARKISFSSCTTTASRRSTNAISVLPQLAKEFGLGLVAANDVHFLERSHHDATMS
jgi:DNA polymerase-3 subunit alpha